MTADFSSEMARQEALREELLSDESIEWSGQPDPSVIFSKTDVFMVPFSLLWGGFAIFWELTVTGAIFHSVGHNRPPVFFSLFGLPFVVMGLYFIFGRFFYKSWKKKRTVYAVTNRRVIVLVSGVRGRSVDATFFRDIPTINKLVGRDGIGTVQFGNAVGRASYYGNTGMEWMNSAYGAVPTFYDIRDANTVYELVNRLRNEPNGRPY